MCAMMISLVLARAQFQQFRATPRYTILILIPIPSLVLGCVQMRHTLIAMEIMEEITGH